MYYVGVLCAYEYSMITEFTPLRLQDVPSQVWALVHLRERIQASTTINTVPHKYIHALLIA